jgi:hypothetical protein
MAPSSNISLRIIQNEQQITEALQFRFRIYRKVFPKCVEGLAEPFESDLYDTRSIHLGMYGNDTNKLIAYCRMILPPAYQSQFSQWMVKQHPKFMKLHAGLSKTQRLAFINHITPHGVRAKINSYCKSLEKNNDTYIEMSRLIIDEEYRSIALSTFFISGVIAVCNSLNISYTLFTCDHHHQSFYQKFGLNRYKDIEPFYTDFWNRRVVFYGSELDISPEFKEPVALLRQQFENGQQITFQKIYRRAA